MSELIEVGYTKKPKGIEGYLKIHVEDDYITDISKARALFIDLDGSHVPFLIEKFVEDGQLMVKLDEVDTPQMASLYCAKTIFLHTDEVSYNPENNNEKSFLVGFSIMDLNQVQRGTIVSILEYPNQIMAEVDNGGPEPFLLPIHEDHIISIDETNKVVNMDVPEGIDDLR